MEDKYTELITEVNRAVNVLENGAVTVVKASEASNADYATSAGNVGTTNSATTARIAQYASTDTSKGTIEERLSAVGY